MNKREKCKNIFVLGYDEYHSRDLLQIPDRDRFRFHPLLHSNQLLYQQKYEIDKSLEMARHVLNDFDGTIDGIVCHWDFPATSIAAILCQEFGLRSPTLEAVLKCSHKYWSRLEQQKVVPHNTPAFCAVDPFSENPLNEVTLDYPFWIKPIKGYSSRLGFRINEARDFQRALPLIRNNIRRIGDPFNTILARIDLPAEMRHVNGNYLIAEEIIQGRELAPEGSIQDGVYMVHGVIDMIRDMNHKSFLRYEYPSQCPKSIQQRAISVSEKVLRQVGFDNGCFNMEYFWDKTTDDFWIIEVNPRISQSHSYQFEMVDGMSNHEIAIHVASGGKPHFTHGGGNFNHAAKFLLRRYDLQDALVTRIPTKEDLSRLKDIQPDTKVTIKVKKDIQLSSLPEQDAYSYVLAEIHVAAATTRQMREKYNQALQYLPFEFQSLDGEQ